jgi:hypothetical protein
MFERKLPFFVKNRQNATFASKVVKKCVRMWFFTISPNIIRLDEKLPFSRPWQRVLTITEFKHIFQKKKPLEIRQLHPNTHCYQTRTKSIVFEL